MLCAFLRLPYTAEADLPAGDANARHAYLALREARHTVIRLIRDHLSFYPEPRVDFVGALFTGGTLDFSSANGTPSIGLTLQPGARCRPG